LAFAVDRVEVVELIWQNTIRRGMSAVGAPNGEPQARFSVSAAAGSRQRRASPDAWQPDPFHRGRGLEDEGEVRQSRQVGGIILDDSRLVPALVLACDAIKMAAAVRGGRAAIDGVIFHTDRGSTYTAMSFTTLCRSCGCRNRWAESVQFR
jgi:hypothetical protein